MSSNIAQKLSILVHNQLPDYIADNNATYVAFLRAYYEYLEQNDSAHYSIQHARSYKDIDQTIDDFVDYFLKEYAYSIPLDIFSTTDDQTKRWFVKYASSLFKAKGSPNALKFLFRLAFGEEIDVIYPSDFLLRPSDGRFNRDVVIRTHIDDATANLANLLYKTFSGAQSGVYSSVDGYTELSDTYVDLYLTDTDFYGTTFQLEPGESLIFDDTGNVTANITVLPVLTDISIVEPGLGYTLGDIITITPQGPGYFYGNVINMIRNSEGANAGAGVANAGILPEYWANNTISIKNFALYTANVANTTGWANSRCYYQGAVIEAPDGTITATKQTEGTQTATHRIYNYTSLGIEGSPSANVFLSCYFKAGTGTNAAIRYADNSEASAKTARFDILNGTVLDAPSDQTAGIYPVGNGWFRAWISGNNGANANFVYFMTDNGIDVSYTGDGISYHYLWNPMIEVARPGQVAPSGRISTVTSNANVIFDYGSGIGLERTLANTTLINGVEGQRITYDGVAAETGNIIITFDELLDIDIESTYTGSAYWQLISGSTANISSIYFGSGEFDISNSYIASNVSNVITQLNENLTRISHTFESMPTAENANLYLALEVQANTTINVTFDIGGIQFEEASANTSYKNPTSLYAYDSNQPTTITASIEKVGVAGDIVSVAVNQIGANISNATIITVSGGDDTREGSYTYDATANVATIKLSTKHGLEALDNVNLIVSTGNLVSNVYSVYESHTLQSFKVWFDDGTTNNSSGNLTLTYMKAANLQPVIGAISKQESGYGIDVRGQLDTTIRLQNSEKWQDYSYVIRSTLDIDTWLELVKQTLHPAGMALFGELSIYSEIDADTESVYAGPEGPDNEGLAGGAWDVWTQLILLLTTDNAVKVEVTLPPGDDYAHYTLEGESYIYKVESYIPKRLGPSRETIEQFKFEYSNAFPISTISGNSIDYFSQPYYNVKTNIEPPNYISYVSPYTFAISFLDKPWWVGAFGHKRYEPGALSPEYTGYYFEPERDEISSYGMRRIRQSLISTTWADAISGTPGTAPTNYNLTVADGSLEVNGEYLTFTGNSTQRHFISTTSDYYIDVEAGERWCLEVNAIDFHDGNPTFNDIIHPGYGTSTWSIVTNSEGTTTNGTQISATGNIWMIIDITGSGTLAPRFGRGCNTVSNLPNVTLTQPSVTKLAVDQVVPHPEHVSRGILGDITDESTFNVELTMIERTTVGSGPGIVTENADGSFTITDEETARFKFPEICLRDNTWHKVSIEVLELDGEAFADFCDKVDDNVTGTYELSVGTNTFIARRSAYDSTYRFVDVRANTGSNVTILTPKLYRQGFQGWGIDGSLHSRYDPYGNDLVVGLGPEMSRISDLADGTDPSVGAPSTGPEVFGWTAYGTPSTAEVLNGTDVHVITSNNNEGVRFDFQDSSIGKVYRVFFDNRIEPTHVYIAGMTILQGSPGNQTLGPVEFKFKVISTDPRIYFRGEDNSAGEFTLGRLSIKEIYPIQAAGMVRNSDIWNYYSYYNDIDTFNQSRITVTDSSESSLIPGTPNKIAWNGTSGAAYFYKAQTYTANATYCAQAIVKADEETTFGITFSSSAGWSVSEAYTYDLSNITASGGSATECGIRHLGKDWYLCWGVATFGTSTISSNYPIYVTPSNASGNGLIVAAVSIDVREGPAPISATTNASNYIEADVVGLDPTSIGYDQSNGGVFIPIHTPFLSPDYYNNGQVLLGAYTNSSNRALLYNQSNNLGVYVINGGVVQWSTSSATPEWSAFEKQTIVWRIEENDGNLLVNGVSHIDDSNITLPEAGVIQIGGVAGQRYYGAIEGIYYFEPNSLTNEQLSIFSSNIVPGISVL